MPDMPNNELEELDNTITLTDEDGQEESFEILDLVEYQGGDYAILLPVTPAEDEDDSTVIILKVEDGPTEDTENYVNVEDEALLAEIFHAFKEKNADRFTFTDEA